MALTPEEIKAIQQQSVPFSAQSPTTPGSPSEEIPEGMTMYPTLADKAAALALGSLQGGTKGTLITGGAIQGLRTGLNAPVPPQLRGLTGVAGALVGGATGFAASEGLDTLLFDEAAQLMRPDVAAYREGAKTTFEMLSSAPHMLRIPVMTGNRVSRFISDLGEVARKKPLTFVAGEAIAAVPAGVAGGTIYAYDPEAKGTRFVGELAAGLLTPSKLLINGAAEAKDFLKGMFGSASAQGRQISAENSAAKQLQKILETHEQDIPTLITMLEKPLPGGLPSTVTPTAAQKTGNKTLIEIERALGNFHVKFAADTQAQGNEALKAYALLVDRLRDVGTPEALTQAAQLRSKLFDEMLAGRLATADRNAAEKVARLRKDTPQARAQIGDIIKSETSIALQNARDVERSLWDEALRQVTAPVERQIPVPPIKHPSVARPSELEALLDLLGPKLYDQAMETGVAPKTITKIVAPTLAADETFKVFLDRMSQVGTAAFESTVPAAVRNIMQDLGATKASVLRYKDAKNVPENVGKGADELVKLLGASYKSRERPVSELINYRSNLLDLARDAAGRGEVSDANLYGTLAEALLTDISKLKSPAFDMARDFSRALNDTFTRTFANTATYQGSVARTGAERLPAEILVTRAFGSNADVTAQRMMEIEDAVKFMRTRYDQAVQQFGPRSPQAQMLKPLAEMSDQSVRSIQDAQARALRLLAAETVDPITGRVNPKQLQNFVDQNQAMLSKLGLLNDMTDAVKAEMALRLVAKQDSVLNKTLRQQTAFAQVLKGGENPTTAVTDVLNSRSPVAGMNRLMQLAKTGGTPAMEGLRATLMDYAFTKAGGIDKFDPVAFQQALFQPLAPNKPSLITLMRQNGMIDFGGTRAIVELTRPMIRIQQVMATKQSLDEVIKDSGPITDLALRILGSKLGAGAAGHKGPGTLIAAAAGSKAMRQVFDRMPAGAMRATMEQAMRDPELLALFLRKTTSPEESRSVVRSIMTRLVVGGALPAATMNLLEREPRREMPLEDRVRQLRGAGIREQAPPLRGVPSIAPVAPPVSPGAPQGGQKTSMGPQEQNMYQNLFPQDTISALMAQQQPEQG